jgi:hypothetical protein
VTKWDDTKAVRARRQVATAMSRQAHRLERQLPRIRAGAEQWLGNARAGQAVWQFADRQAEFAHVIVAGYRAGRYAPIAALCRTLFEDCTLLSWCAIPNDSTHQAPRVLRVLLGYYRRAQNMGAKLPPDAVQLLKTTTGTAARRPPSMEDRVKQLDADESAKTDGKAFWMSHLDHVAVLNDYVHSELGGGGRFTDPMTRELLGFEALVFSHQYLTLGIVSTVRLTEQDVLAARAQEAFGRIHDQEMRELSRLIKP